LLISFANLFFTYVCDYIVNNIFQKECAEIDDEKASSSKTSVHRKLCVEYQANHWSPQFLYRTMSDLTVAAIRLSGSEGSGRTEIGRFYGMNTRSKTGNRKVSRHIINALKLFPAYFGQYQKMEGRCRTLRYYYKFSSGPKSFNTLFAEWKNINGSDCPFTMGQVIKFPNANLSTLRISDVSLRRLMDIVRLIKEKSVIVTMARLHKKIIEIEKGYEYGHLIDKRSIRKCLKALEKVKLLHVFETTVRHDETQHKVYFHFFFSLIVFLIKLNYIFHNNSYFFHALIICYQYSVSSMYRF
uniref:TFIIE_alpha domain-containing protein n=1 Tax=Dracunculus medinensis TaxID=318479 RepID=A0A0N4U8G2_DRAME